MWFIPSNSCHHPIEWFTEGKKTKSKESWNYKKREHKVRPKALVDGSTSSESASDYFSIFTLWICSKLFFFITFKFIFLFKTTNCFFILYLRFSSPIQILFLNTTVISLLCTFLQVWSTTCSSTTSWNMWVFSGDMPLEVFKNYLWEHFYWKKKMYIFSYFSCLTSGPYNKAAATVKEEET